MSDAAALQDFAADGREFRKLRLKNGDVVTASIYLREAPEGYAGTLRFKTSGLTIQLPVGSVASKSRVVALKLLWKLVREQKKVEEKGWQWVTA